MNRNSVLKCMFMSLLLCDGCVFASTPVWWASDPPWPCSYGFPVWQYGSSFADAFDNLLDFKLKRCFIGCASTPYPPPSTNCRYRYAFENLLTGTQCTLPGTCFRYRYFDTQNPQNGWKTADTYFRMANDPYSSCPDGSVVTTDDYAQLDCRMPLTPWNEEKNLGMMCPGIVLAGNPVNVATGNKVHHEVDVSGSMHTLRFERFHNSRSSRDIGLGPGWSASFLQRLEPGAFRLVVRDVDGRGEQWNYSTASQAWFGDADSRISLVQTNNEFVLTRADDSVERYHFTGRLLSITSVTGVTTTLVYADPDNPERLVGISNSLGASLAFTYTPDDRIASVTDHAGNTRTYAYDAGGNLEYVYLPDGTADGYTNNPYRRYHYNEPALIGNGTYLPHHLTGISDSDGVQEVRYASYEYYADGRARASYHAGNAERIDITYDDINNTRTLTNGQGVQSVYAISIRLGVAQVTDISGPGCATCSTGNSGYTYDPASNSLLTQTENGVTTEYGDYAASGNPGYRIEARATPQERRTDYTYDPRYVGRVAVITEPSVHTGSSKVTAYSYDAYGNRTAETISGFRTNGTPVSRTTTREYNGPLHQLSRIDGPRTDVSDITLLRYYPDDTQEGNNRARLQEVEDATGVLTRSNIQYTATGKVASEDRPNGLSLGYTYYPGNDRLATLTVSGTSGTRATRWTYLATGEVETITTADGTPDATTVAFGYDAARRLVRVTDGLGNFIEYTLDTEGNRTAEQTRDSSSSLYRALTRTFDAYGRLDLGRSGSDPASPLELVDADYAPDGSLDRTTDGNGIVTDYSYDVLKRLLGATRDAGGTDPSTANALTQYGHDVADRLVTVTDPNNGTTTYRYDDLGNLLTTISPDTGTTAYTYDAAGNMLSKTTASGTSEAVTHTYSYDVLNRLVGVTTPDQQADITYSYDNCPNGAGRLCRVTTGSATVFYGYDGFGNISAHQGVSYTHDAANRPRTISYPSGAMVTYGYDTAGLVSSVDLTVDGKSQSLAGAITYLPFGGIAALTYGNGQTLTQGWDSAYRLTAQSVPGVMALSYPVYDRNGNLIRRDDSLAGTGTFGYDPLDRLIASSGPFGTGWSYGYDRNGNRLFGDDDGTVSLSYEPASNRLDRIGTADVVLDVAGNMLAKGNWSYDYTVHQRLATARDTGLLAASFAYNGLGQRVAKDHPDGSGAVFLYGTDGALLAETDQGGNVLVEYIYLNGRLLAIYLPDTDRDGRTNRAEAAQGTSPASPDDDSDGLTNRDELLNYGSLIGIPDTDGDGVSDGAEVASGTDPTDPGSVSVPGDINADGQVDVADYLLLNQFVLGIRTLTAAQQVAADLNQDGQLSAGDLVILSRTLLGLTWLRVINSAFGQTLIAAWDGLLRQAEAAVTQGELYYVHTDHLGTPQVMTDEAGSAVWRATYDPFGRATVTVSTVELNVRFPGQYYDAETGLHYNYFRYYDPLTGRYITSDPAGLDGGLNTYGYAQGNPIRYTDALGLWVKRCMRKLGNKENGNADQYSVFRHDYLNISGSILSFQSGDNMLWSQGRIDFDESTDRMCTLVCDDEKFDEYVFEAAGEIGAPIYCVIAYTGTYQHLFGARNCQTWVDDVLALAKEKYLKSELCPECFN